MEVQCEYKTIQVLKAVSTEIRYMCRITDISLTSPNQKISSVTGSHSNGRTNEDVKEVLFTNTDVLYFPRGLNKFFPNMETLRIEDCKLRMISMRDLEGLENLDELRVTNNQLITLPSDLFTKMRKLRKISFKGNKLKYLRKSLFDPVLEKVTEIDLRDNVTVCYYGYESLYYNGKGSHELLFQSINANFESPIDDEVYGKYVESLTDGFKNLWLSKKYSDFTFVVEKKRFPVHKNVLGAQSSVFATIFDIDMKEKEQGELLIEDFSAGAVEEFLEFLYTGKVPDVDNAMELFALSSKYDVPNFRLYWEEIVIRNVDDSNAFEVFQMGHLHDSEKMKVSAFKEIRRVNKGIFLPDELLEHPESLKEIVEAAITRKRKIQEADDEFNDIYEKYCKKFKKETKEPEPHVVKIHDFGFISLK